MNPSLAITAWRSVAACAVVLLAGCATPWQRPVPTVAAPERWYAPLPHNGAVTQLSAWWGQHGDPILLELIEAAQAASPNLISAASRVRQAQAARVAAASLLEPQVDAQAGVSRSQTQIGVPRSTALQLGVQAAWELDLWGGRALQRDAAGLRVEGAQALWHDARVAVAAETASQVLAWRHCQRVLTTLTADAASRAETARLTALAAGAGFQPPAAAALARASAAEGKARVTAQSTQCDADVKVLVALTALSELVLQEKLKAASANSQELAPIVIASLPADVLAQRPDLAAAAAEVLAASADLGASETERYPRLSLMGSIGSLDVRAGGASTHLNTWSIGPLAINLPWLDGKRRAAQVEAARARYEEATALYAARARAAVREVEAALLNLRSTASRDEDARVATVGYAAFFNATQARYRNGLANLVELEDARRVALAADIALQGLRLERQLAWVSLYRAAGGGWDRDTSAATATTSAAGGPSPRSPSP